VFIGLVILGLILLLAGCSANAQPIPVVNAPNLSAYSGIFNLTASSTNSVALAAPVGITKRGSVQLKWDASSDLTVTGYRIYWGTNSGSYLQSLDVGTNTTARVANLDEGVMHYFAATAYDSIGIESPFSNEASTITGFYVGLTMKVWQVEAYGMRDKTNHIQTSTNLSDWRIILVWVGNGNATNVLHTNSSVGHFRVVVK